MSCSLVILLLYDALYNSVFLYVFFFFFKQKTAYEMRISDWSSDVCSSDLKAASAPFLIPSPAYFSIVRSNARNCAGLTGLPSSAMPQPSIRAFNASPRDRKSVGEGKRVSVRVDLGGRRIIKKKKKSNISI